MLARLPAARKARLKRARARVDDEQLAEIPNRRLQTENPLTTLWDTTGDYSYMELLNDTIFCPQVAGTTGTFVFHPRKLSY